MENENKTITGESIIELKLPETVKKLKIDGRIYKFNVDSIELLRKIEGFGVEARKIAQRSDLKEEEKLVGVLKECRNGINLALGEEAFVELFGDNMDSYLRPLFLLGQLLNICHEATKDVVDFQYSSERTKGRE